MTTAATVLETLGGGDLTTSTGIYPQADGTILAMTLTASRYFKTRAGAERWLAKRLATRGAR